MLNSLYLVCMTAIIFVSKCFSEHERPNIHGVRYFITSSTFTRSRIYDAGRARYHLRNATYNARVYNTIDPWLRPVLKDEPIIIRDDLSSEASSACISIHHDHIKRWMCAHGCSYRRCRSRRTTQYMSIGVYKRNNYSIILHINNPSTSTQQFQVQKFM